MKFSNIFVACGLVPLAHSLTHPGIFTSNANLQRIKGAVAKGQEPWSGAFSFLLADPLTNLARSSNAVASVDSTNSAMRPDSAAAYLTALTWWTNADTRYLAKSIAIINSYVSTVTTLNFNAQITGYMAALKFAAAVELVRSSPTWTATYQSNFNKWATNVIYPICEAGLTGSISGTPGDGNQGAGDLRCIMALGVATDNTTMYQSAVDGYKNNACCGMTAYIDQNGCTGEAGRDMAHPQGALESFSDMAKMAELQGDTSLWSAGSNRLATAWEWMAKRNLNDGTVPYTNTKTCYSQYGGISNTDLGHFAPSYTLPYAYYTAHGVSMPYSAAVIQYVGPELLGGNTGEDTVYGSLVYSLVQNTTAMIVNNGTYNIKTSSGLYVGAPSAGGSLTLGTTPTMSWYFQPAGNNVYRIHPSADTTYAWDSGSSTGGAGYTPYSASMGTLPHQTWKVIAGPGGTVSFTTLTSVQRLLPRYYAFLATNGGSGTKMTMANGTALTSTTQTTQLFTLQSA